MEKKKTFFAAVLFSAAILSSGFFATAGEAPRWDANLMGIWQPIDTAAGHMSMAFHDGGRYEMDLDGDGNGEVLGSYFLSGDEIRLANQKGAVECDGEGTYSYVISSNFLRYYPIDDNCKERLRLHAGVWRKV